MTFGPKLNRVEVEGLRSINSAAVDLEDLNIVIGPNGGGKSNFLSSFVWARRIVDGELQRAIKEAGGANRVFRFGLKTTERVRMKFSFGDNAWEGVLRPTDDEGVLLDETFHFEGTQGPKTRRGATGNSESTLRTDAKHDRGIPNWVAQGMETYSLLQVHDTTRRSAVKQSAEIEDNVSLHSDASNLAPVLFRMQEVGTLKEVEALLRIAAPFFDRFVLRPSRTRANSIRLEWKERGNSQRLDAHALSDGTLRFLCILTALLQPEVPRVVIIDEPELGLHPTSIHTLAALMRSTVRTKDVQIIAATQSVTLLNQVRVKEIIVVDRKDEPDGTSSTAFRRPSRNAIKHWISDYAPGELWEKNLLGGRP